MAFRAGCLLFFFTTLLVFGCRDPLTPNVDRNFAPETWITAAPQDTITGRNDEGTPVVSPIGTISARYHMYWAGSDPDGDVAGFFFAVVETVPTPPPGFTTVPPLPGPKPQDYKFTTKTDSLFLFSVSEVSPDRQHAFFIYAVDNLGKPDPTPARVIFNALDRFPPLPVIPLNGGAVATGNVYTMVSSGVTTVSPQQFFINDSLTFDNFFLATTDTVPTAARLDFNWRGEPTIAGVTVSGFRYKLDESDFLSVDSSVTSVSYNAGSGSKVVLPGSKLFTLRAIDDAGGAREVTRRFEMNFQPDTWFAGPDPNGDPRIQTDANGDPFLEVPDWATFDGLMGSYMGCDSFMVRPGARPERRTFLELYENRLYIRSEFDTVHMNSWVVFHNGGSDVDSPYPIEASPVEPALADTINCNPAWVVRPEGPTGSALGFHSLYVTDLTPNGPTTRPSESSRYPIFDPASVFRSATIASYRGMRRAGTVYALFRAEDGNGSTDKRIQQPNKLVEKVDSNMGTPEEEKLRSKVMVFYVNKSPKLHFASPQFVPQPDTTFLTRTLDLNLLAIDDDPFEQTTAPPFPGGPSSGSLFRYLLTVTGKNVDNRDTTYMVPGSTPLNPYLFTPQISFTVPTWIVSTEVTINIEICDCPRCEIEPGTGRCTTQSIRVNVPAPPAPPIGSEVLGSNHRSTRPGSPIETRRTP